MSFWDVEVVLKGLVLDDFYFGKMQQSRVLYSGDYFEITDNSDVALGGDSVVTVEVSGTQSILAGRVVLWRSSLNSRLVVPDTREEL